MMFLLTCDKKLTKSQLSPTHASTKRKITDELKHNAGWYEVREGSPVEVHVGSAELSPGTLNDKVSTGCRAESRARCDGCDWDIVLFYMTVQVHVDQKTA